MVIFVDVGRDIPTRVFGDDGQVTVYTCGAWFADQIEVVRSALTTGSPLWTLLCRMKYITRELKNFRSAAR